jgi:hypothetical protein
MFLFVGSCTSDVTDTAPTEFLKPFQIKISLPFSEILATCSGRFFSFVQESFDEKQKAGTGPALFLMCVYVAKKLSLC